MGKKISSKINLGVLISGRGSNLQALIDACQDPDYPAQIALVISNKADAQGLQRAEKAGIQTAVILHKDYESKDAFEAAMQEALAEQNIDLICLAGFMRILSADFITNWPDKIINIHPSLLPKFKGLDAQKQALEAGETQSGCTIHFVVPDMDSGPIILQKQVPVLPGDTEDTLSARILEQEHIAYPQAVRAIAENRVNIIGGRVEISPELTSIKEA